MTTKYHELGKFISAKTYIRRVGKRAVCCICGQKIEWHEPDFRLLIYAKGRSGDKIGASFHFTCAEIFTSAMGSIVCDTQYEEELNV